jgi:uncharacterized protein
MSDQMSDNANPSPPNAPPFRLNDEEMEMLGTILVSDAVPEDCMDLEMLDGFLAGVLLSPRPIAREDWLPEVWSAYGDADFGSGATIQNAILLVLSYYNELASTLGRDDEYAWEPFCFAAGDDGTQGIGEAWSAGLIQGLELWPEDWREGLIDEIAEAVQDTLQQIVAPWENDEDVAPDDETRLAWLETAGEAVNSIFARWRYLGLPAPRLIALDIPASSPEAGRNEPCPCGSGKKFKKCCGAVCD